MTGKRLDVERAIGIVAEHCPDLLNALIHALFKINEGVGAPELFLNLVPGHNLARVAGEQNQKFERQGRQLDQTLDLSSSSVSRFNSKTPKRSSF